MPLCLEGRGPTIEVPLGIRRLTLTSPVPPFLINGNENWTSRCFPWYQPPPYPHPPPLPFPRLNDVFPQSTLAGELGSLLPGKASCGSMALSGFTDHKCWMYFFRLLPWQRLPGCCGFFGLACAPLSHVCTSTILGNGFGTSDPCIFIQLYISP